MYGVLITCSDMSYDDWSLSSNVSRKVLMQVLSKMVSLHCIRVYDCRASAIYLKLGK